MDMYIGVAGDACKMTSGQDVYDATGDDLYQQSPLRHKATHNNKDVATNPTRFPTSSQPWRKKRRRWQLSRIISFLCTFCVISFIAGNVIMLRHGFVQLYTSTLGGGYPIIPHEPLQDSAWHSGGHPSSLRWKSRDEPLLNLRVDLPTSALAGEPRLRKLMEEDDAVYSYSASQRVAGNVRGSVNQTLSRKSSLSVAVSDVRKLLVSTSQCSSIRNITRGAILGSGFTKIVRKGLMNGRVQVAIKTVDVTGNDVTNCFKKYGGVFTRCYDKAAGKILKEIVLLRGLDHPNVVKVKEFARY